VARLILASDGVNEANLGSRRRIWLAIAARVIMALWRESNGVKAAKAASSLINEKRYHQRNLAGVCCGMAWRNGVAA